MYSSHEQARTLPQMFQHLFSAIGIGSAATTSDARVSGRPHGPTGMTKYVDCSALVAAGVQPRDRVGILSGTRREWLAADLAILSTGAVTVGIYDTHTAEQCHYILKHSGVRVLFVEDRDQFFKVRAKWTDLPSWRPLYYSSSHLSSRVSRYELRRLSGPWAYAGQRRARPLC